MRPAVMVMLVAAAVMLAAGQTAATSASSGKDDGSGGYTRTPPPSKPGHGGSSPPPRGGGYSPGHRSPPRSPPPRHSSPPPSPPPRGGGYSPGHHSPPRSPPPRHSSPPPRHSSPPPRGGGYNPGHSSPPPSPNHGSPPPSPGHGQPDCKEKGGMCGDPKIVGGDGVVFYFHGRKDQDFCLVSDTDLHINAHFIGKRPLGRPHDFTWVQALGFVFGGHTLTIAAKRVATWDSRVDQLELAYDSVPLDLQAAQPWTSADGAMAVKRIGGSNAVDVAIREKMGVALTVVPIGAEENRVHKYGIGGDDCFAHLDMQFRFHNLSSGVNGVLGQTYAAGWVNPVKRGVAMPIMGGADRFRSSSLLVTDCPTSQYRGEAIPLGSAMPSFTATCGSDSGLAGGAAGGITCRR